MGEKWLYFKEVLEIVVGANFLCKLGRDGLLAALDGFYWILSVRASNMAWNAVIMKEINRPWQPELDPGFWV